MSELFLECKTCGTGRTRAWKEPGISVAYTDEGKLWIERLHYQLCLVQRNKTLLLHAGDCAETFDTCTHENISSKIGLILSFSLILIWGGRLPVVRIGRTAGQYAKSRTSNVERAGD